MSERREIEKRLNELIADLVDCDRPGCRCQEAQQALRTIRDFCGAETPRPRHLFVHADLLSAPQYDLLIEIDGTGSLVFKPFRLRGRDDAPPGFPEGPWAEFVEAPGGLKR